MNVVVPARDLISEVTFLERVVSNKPTLPILSSVMLQAQDGWLHMSATDLEIGLVTACQATVKQEGAITLPAKRLMDLAKSLSDLPLELSQDPRGAVKLVGGTFTSRLQSLPAHDFPSLPSVEGDTVTLPRQEFRSLLSKVRYAVNERDVRHTIKGALLTLPENDFALVATDSHRLSLAGAKRVGPAAQSVLFPSKTLDHLISLLNESGTSDVEFSRSDRHLFFQIDGRVLISRRLEGAFPNYERVIPKNAKHVVTVDKAKLARVVERAILISETVTLTLESNAIEVTAASAEIGDAGESVPAIYDGEKMAIKLQGQYVLDFLGAAVGASVQMSLTSETAPALFSDGGNYVNVVMGMRS